MVHQPGAGRHLHPVAMVDVDVDVQHALVELQQLQDAEHDVVDVAEAAGLGLLRVVQAPGPVDGDVGLRGPRGPGRTDPAAGRRTPLDGRR